MSIVTKEFLVVGITRRCILYIVTKEFVFCRNHLSFKNSLLFHFELESKALDQSVLNSFETTTMFAYIDKKEGPLPDTYSVSFPWVAFLISLCFFTELYDLHFKIWIDCWQWICIWRTLTWRDEETIWFPRYPALLGINKVAKGWSFVDIFIFVQWR